MPVNQIGDSWTVSGEGEGDCLVPAEKIVTASRAFPLAAGN